MKFAVKTLGCKVNQYESEYFINSLIEKGLQLVDLKDNPDIVIINSCSVTEEAKRQSFQLLRKAKRLNPFSKIIFTGCVVDETKSLKIADIEISNFYKKNLSDLIKEENKRFFIKEIHNEDKFQFLQVNKFFNTTRAFLKIQDGCNNYCSYCIIPYVRGKPRSLNKDEIINSILRLSENYKEVVLCGINIELYGVDSGLRDGFFNLLNEINEELSRRNIKNFRIRLSSLKPDKVNEKFVKLITESEFFCNHFHLSIQNLNDVVLKLMNRKYTFKEIERCINLIKSYNELSNIGADIITGFVNETDERFSDNVKKLENLDINYLHIFPFSMKKGTKAENFKEIVSKEDKKNRVKILKNIANNKKRKFLEKNLNKPMRVLIEKKEGSYHSGYSDNYLKIYVKLDLNQLKNKFINVICKSVEKEGLKGGEIYDN